MRCRPAAAETTASGQPWKSAPPRDRGRQGMYVCMYVGTVCTVSSGAAGLELGRQPETPRPGYICQNTVVRGGSRVLCVVSTIHRPKRLAMDEMAFDVTVSSRSHLDVIPVRNRSKTFILTSTGKTFVSSHLMILTAEASFRIPLLTLFI